MHLTIIWALGERKKPVPFKAEKISKENVHIKVFVHCRLKSMAIIHTHMCVWSFSFALLMLFLHSYMFCLHAKYNGKINIFRGVKSDLSSR